MTTRLAVALAAYLALGAIAFLLLDGLVRTALLLFFIGLAIRTIIASREPPMD
jgi:hypothetical protein